MTLLISRTDPTLKYNFVKQTCFLHSKDRHTSAGTIIVSHKFRHASSGEDLYRFPFVEARRGGALWVMLRREVGEGVGRAMAIGQPAPDFARKANDDKEYKLSDLNGKNVVLAFYPLDFSPICTDEH